MNEPTRRAWSSPELIVLVRGKPEEAVLEFCKSNSVKGPGPGVAYNYCNAEICGSTLCSEPVVS